MLEQLEVWFLLRICLLAKRTLVVEDSFVAEIFHCNQCDYSLT